MENAKQPDLPEGKIVTELSPVEAERRFTMLYSLLAVVLLALVILSLGLNLFIWRQMSLVRRQLEENRRTVAEYQRTSEPLVKDFLNKLQTFSDANKDFRPILAKYISPAALTGAAPARATTSPPPAKTAAPPSTPVPPAKK